MSIYIPQILKLETIKKQLLSIDVFESIKDGFIAFSKGEAVIPPVGELVFTDPPGDVHIKYGYLKSQPYYVVKIASGFYENPKNDLPSSQGLNLLFDKSNGVLLCILLDEGHLTDVRTAIAGALASKALSNSDAKKIGIVGAGVQGEFQAIYHSKLFPDAHFTFWNRSSDRCDSLVHKLGGRGFNVQTAVDLKEMCRNSDIIVTTTASNEILIHTDWISEGTHITAVGSDSAHKIELDPGILADAQVVTVDSLDQSKSRGEVFRSTKDGAIVISKVMELGAILADNRKGRQNKGDITVADLTGVAVQDLMISQAVFDSLKLNE